MTSASHVVLPGSQRRPSRGAHALGVADPDEWLEVTVKLRRKAPLPPVMGHPETSLPRAELAEKYGSSDEDIQKVRTAFKSLGLEVSEGNRATRDVRVSGPIHAIEAAFQVKLMHYAHDRGVYRGRVGNIEIPAELKDIVVGVFGLDDRPVVKRKRVSAGIASLPKAVLHRRVQSRSNSSTAQRSGSTRRSCRYLRLSARQWKRAVDRTARVRRRLLPERSGRVLQAGDRVRPESRPHQRR